ncbi:MAG: M28 family peptidase [Candidatus Lokiarchaeota archaeon]|nr:M28 family peptidase [Candidatus Lokiarchaeota archaeon]
MSVEELENKMEDNHITSKIPNEDNAYRITERLAFPRLVGSEGEKRAREIVSDEFKKVGYNPIYKDDFETSFYIWNAVRYAFIPMGICLILLALSFFINSWLTLGLIVLNLYICTKILGLATTREIKLFGDEEKNFTTQNIYTDLKSKNSKAKVIFIGHWDSKSQTFPSSLRIILFMVALFSFIVIILLYLILSIIQLIFTFNNLILNNMMLYSCAAISIISNLNYFNKTGNKSPGAYDNAAAVGVIIELARYYKHSPLDNIDFIFLSTSSEELNLGGAKHFIQNHKKEFERNSAYFINLDPIGGNELIRLITSYGIPRKSSSKKLKDLFLNSASELDIRIKDVYLPTGAWSDYMPIVQEGFEACWLGSQPGLKYVHTKKDNLDLVSKQGIKNILLLCVDVIKKLENEYNK